MPSHSRNLHIHIATPYARQLIHHIVGLLRVTPDLLHVLHRLRTRLLRKIQRPLQLGQPRYKFGLRCLRRNLEKQRHGRRVELEAVLHGDYRFCQARESVELIAIVLVEVFELCVQPVLFLFQFVLESLKDACQLLLDLEFDGADVLLDGGEVLLLLLLPFEQTFRPADPHQLTVDTPHCLLVTLHARAQLLDALTDFDNVEFMSVVFLLETIAAHTVLAEQRHALTLRLRAEVSYHVFRMLPAPQRHTRQQRVLKHSNPLYYNQLISLMLRKKNYKQEDHFTQYYSIYLPRSNGSRLTLYYKRYRPAKPTPTSPYALIHPTHAPEPAPQFPLDRTLEVLSFDGNLEIARAVFKKVGKVRKFISGETKYAGSTAYYCIVVFKFEFDLVKCFRDDFLQDLASREHKEEKAGEADREDYQNQLITTYLADELKDVSKLEELHKEGYNVITNKQGEFKVDYEANQKSIEDLPQVRRQKKKEAKQELLRQKLEQSQ